MKNEKLIQELVKKNAPVTSMSSPVKAFFKWLLICFFCLTIGIGVLGMREDYQTIFHDPEVWILSLINLALSIASALSAFLLSIPDRHRKAVYLIPLLTFLAWAGLLIYQAYQSDFSNAGTGWSCIRDVIVLSGIPSIVLVLMLLKGSVLQLGITGGFAFLSTAALGAFGSQFICHNDSPFHIFLWHFLPVFILGSLGVILGRYLLKAKWM